MTKATITNTIDMGARRPATVYSLAVKSAPDIASAGNHSVSSLMGDTRWVSFGPDMPLAELPEAMRNCLTNQATQECDNIIGNADQGQGYCSDPLYKRTTYCACVNNKIGCAQYAMASCANSAYAYKPWNWYRPTPGGKSYDSECSTKPICVNIVEVEGGQNIMPNVNQQCGTITNITNVLSTNPTLAALSFILFLAFIYVMSIRTDSPSGSKRQPPPPPDDMFS